MSYELLAKVFELIKDERLLTGTVPEDNKVLEYLTPTEIQRKLPLAITKDGLPEDILKYILDVATKYSLRTTHSAFYNQLFGGADPYGLCASILAEALNTSAYTFEVAPVFTIIEIEFISYICKLFGWGTGEGLFCAGGIMSNMYSLVLARNVQYPELKTAGLWGQPLAAFVSEDAHYWVQKSALWLGLGSDNIYKVQTDENGRMIPGKLDEAIKFAKSSGKRPFYAVSTAGTTVIGAYDDLRAVSRVCKEHGIWLHVDACWGGAVVLSDKYKHYLDGSELADSISWNPHKLLCIPLHCCIFVTKHVGKLKQALKVDAGYLFQPEKMYDNEFDLGEISVQCSRKVDAFKVWFAFKAYGEEAISKSVTNCFDASRQLADIIRSTKGFELVFEKIQCTNVCFWYIPPSLRGHQRTKDWWRKLDKVGPIMKQRMVKAGSLMVGFQALGSKGLCNFFRMVVTTKPERTLADMQYVVDEMQRLGKDIAFD